MWLVVGLGNPGANYDDTRHNIGFKVLDELARLEAIDCRKLEKSAAVGKGSMEGYPVILCKPVTFMNNSGAGGKCMRGRKAHAVNASGPIRQPASVGGQSAVGSGLENHGMGNGSGCVGRYPGACSGIHVPVH